jgi:protein-S-isoprenylcysteine O-methyltransferase Ste14
VLGGDRLPTGAQHDLSVSGVLFALGDSAMFATLPPVRLQKLALVGLKGVAESVPIAARVAGLQLSADPVRTWGSVGVLALGALWLCSLGSIPNWAAIACFLVAFSLRFAFLFASFTPRGIAPRLQTRFGLERGHMIYGLALDLLLFTQRVSFVVLACATAREPGNAFGVALQVLGFVLVPVGLGVTVWATRVAGHDAYRYRDLFTGCRHGSLADDGPYLVCANPMYAFGPLAGYGLALLALSPGALLVAGVNHALLFVFNNTVEQPRLRRANSVFVETQRRYELARSLLGFDPRQELTQRRHLEPSLSPAAVDKSDVAADANHVAV